MTEPVPRTVLLEVALLDSKVDEAILVGSRCDDFVESLPLHAIASMLSSSLSALVEASGYSSKEIVEMMLDDSKMEKVDVGLGAMN